MQLIRRFGLAVKKATLHFIKTRTDIIWLLKYLESKFLNFNIKALYPNLQHNSYQILFVQELVILKFLKNKTHLIKNIFNYLEKDGLCFRIQMTLVCTLQEYRLKNQLFTAN